MKLFICLVFVPITYCLHFVGKLLFYTPLNKAVIGQEKALIISGSAAIDNALEDFFEILNVKYLALYGMTEAGMISSETLKDQCLYSVGKPFFNQKVKIVDPETKNILPANKKGLIVVKSEQTLKGYYKNDDETKKAFTDDGFLITGDMGWINEKGFLFVNGRYKDVIVLANGVNVEPIPLEHLSLNSAYISQIILAGQDKLYLSAIVYPDMEKCEEWARTNNYNVNNITKSKEFKKLILAEINLRIMKRGNFRFSCPAP